MSEQIEPCSKRTYSDKRNALTAINARTTGRRGNRRNRPTFLRAYYCHDCRGWHLSHGRRAS